MFASSNRQEGLKNFNELDAEISALIKVLKASSPHLKSIVENRTGDLQRCATCIPFKERTIDTLRILNAFWAALLMLTALHYPQEPSGAREL